MEPCHMFANHFIDPPMELKNSFKRGHVGEGF